MRPDRNEDEESEGRCPGCGAPESQWSGLDSKGFVSAGGDLYCCEACAHGHLCNCSPELQESLVKRRSA